MLAQIEFESRIKNGMITIPKEYLADISEEVIVVLKRKTTPLDVLQNSKYHKSKTPFDPVPHKHCRLIAIIDNKIHLGGLT